MASRDDQKLLTTAFEGLLISHTTRHYEHSFSRPHVDSKFDASYLLSLGTALLHLLHLGSGYLDHDLPQVLLRFHVRIGTLHVVELEDPVNHRLRFFRIRCNESHHVLESMW